jgi:hypothetical protein
MSFVDTLSRATDSPATDYHLCIFNNANYRDEVYSFFSDQEVFGIIQEIDLLETRLRVIEIKQHTSKHNPSKKESLIPDNSDEWSLIHQRWQSCKAEFKYLLENFRAEKLNKEHNLSVEKAKVENIVQESRDEDVKQSTPKQSASDFLLSMAGIFDSGLKDTSENVEAVVMDAILKKHGRE